MAQVIEFPSGTERSATLLREGPMTIEPTAATRLRQLRGQRGWSKARLAKESGVSARTISRIENGEYSPHRVTIERLAKAVDVDPGVLTGERPMPTIAGHPTATSAEPAYPFPIRVHPAIRNAYELAASRYHVSVPTLARLAPLLFTIVAEGSLRDRSAEVDEARIKAEAAAVAIGKLPCHGSYVVFDAIEEEEDSIRKKDVFGRRLADPVSKDRDSDNPFVTYLEAEAARFGGGEITINAIGPTLTDYRIFQRAALALAGGEQGLADEFLSGRVLIHQTLRGLTSEQRNARMRDLEEFPEQVPEEIAEYIDPSLAIDL